MRYTNALSAVFYVHMSCMKRFHRTETFDYYDGFAWSTNIFKYYNVERASHIATGTLVNTILGRVYYHIFWKDNVIFKFKINDVSFCMFFFFLNNNKLL